ncbi:MAG: DNA gyrase inhibitor YacG [Nitrospirota bacterium]
MKAKCPVCHKETVWEENKYRPFCSNRCRLIDLGVWVDGGYRITGDTNNKEKEEQEKSKKL